MDQAVKPPCGVANLRDVGLTVNRFLGERRMRECLFYRSARPDEATADDKALIRDGMGIKTIIDLRTRTELLQQKYARQTAASADAAPTSVRIEGVEYREISLAGRAFEKYLLSLLNWWDFIKLVFFHFLGYRVPAVSIVVEKIMRPYGPIHLCLATIDHSGPELGEALLLYTCPQTLPSLVHCTHGKDRSGLVCALILMILGIPRPAIEHDYSLSDAGLESKRDEMMAEMSMVGLPDEWLRTSQGMIAATEAHLLEKYGGLECYLDQIAIDEVRRQKIREVLLY